jgi:hypothetical protein
MNLRFYIFYGFVSFFPSWVFRANLEILDILILLFLLLFLPILIHIQLFKVYFVTNPKIIFFWLSLITFNCLDQNLSLWNPVKNGFLFINFNSPYINSLLISILTITILNLIFFLKKIETLKIIFSFILVIFIFNIFDAPKNYSNFPKVNLIENKQEVQNNLNKKIVMIFDEMSGFNSIDTNVSNGKIINQKIKKFFQNNKFNIYENAYALFRDTDQSLGSTLNFLKTKEEYINIDRNVEVHFLKKSNNYFITNDLEKNKFFDLDEHKNIIVNQSMYINYCNHPKVIICNQFNPFDDNLTFLNGFKDTKLTRYISAYRNNGAILSYYIWRVFSQLRLIDTLLDPDGEKASIEFIFNQIFENVKNNNDTSLFFSHIMVPHIPFAFNSQCEYDGDKSINYNRISLNKKRTQHNLEKLCLIKYLDQFFTKLKKIDRFENFEIIIFSDHDSRIVDDDDIKNDVIFVHKLKNSNISLIEDKNVSINNLLYNLSLN